jgi:predicted metal-dependent hydrolase
MGTAREPRSSQFRRGVALFDAGYYWEAHEAWEGLWHAEGRRGATADVLKGLIKLAAAGVKVREGREQGVRTHARRAAESFAAARQQGGAHHLGLDLDQWIERARAIAEDPPADPGPRDAPVTPVFAFRIGE